MFEFFVWQPNSFPKMSLLSLLRALHNKLLTKDKLMSTGVNDSDPFPLCMSRHEPIDHLFFSCPCSSYIWALCKLKLAGAEPSINFRVGCNFF